MTEDQKSIARWQDIQDREYTVGFWLNYMAKREYSHPDFYRIAAMGCVTIAEDAGYWFTQDMPRLVRLCESQIEGS